MGTVLIPVHSNLSTGWEVHCSCWPWRVETVNRYPDPDIKGSDFIKSLKSWLAPFLPIPVCLFDILNGTQRKDWKEVDLRCEREDPEGSWPRGKSKDQEEADQDAARKDWKEIDQDVRQKTGSWPRSERKDPEGSWPRCERKVWKEVGKNVRVKTRKKLTEMLREKTGRKLTKMFSVVCTLANQIRSSSA